MMRSSSSSRVCGSGPTTLPGLAKICEPPASNSLFQALIWAGASWCFKANSAKLYCSEMAATATLNSAVNLRRFISHMMIITMSHLLV